MYKTIVKRRYRRTWAALNRGTTARCWTRSRRASSTSSSVTVFRLFPDARFTVHDTVVEGWPWRTTLAASLNVRATVAGQPYDNQFTQFARLRWGRVTHLRTLEDTQRMAAGCEAMAAAGISEATAQRIEDPAEVEPAVTR